MKLVIKGLHETGFVKEMMLYLATARVRVWIPELEIKRISPAGKLPIQWITMAQENWEPRKWVQMGQETPGYLLFLH